MNKRIFCMLCIGALVSELFSQTYSTSFDLTENPMSEGGKWINGGTVGKDWADFKTKGGRAIGAEPAASFCQDNTALLSGNWGPDQTVSVTIYKEIISSGACELEIRLRSTLSANVCKGYEVCLGVNQDPAGAYLFVVSWDGPVCKWSDIQQEKAYGSTSGANVNVRTGDVLKASIIGNVIKVYINGTLKLEITDNQNATGQPGIGVDGANGGAASDPMGTFGFNDFSVTATGVSTNSAERLSPVYAQRTDGTRIFNGLSPLHDRIGLMVDSRGRETKCLNPQSESGSACHGRPGIYLLIPSQLGSDHDRL